MLEEFNGAVEEREEIKQTWLANGVIYKPLESYIGKPMLLARITENGKEFTTTSKVISIEKVYANIYKVETENSVYITKCKIRTTEG